jgi:hypothetical protein
MRIGAGSERLLELVDQRWFGRHGSRVSSTQGFAPAWMENDEQTMCNRTTASR